MSAPAQEIAPPEGEPFHTQAIVNTQLTEQETEPRSIPAQRPGPGPEVVDPQPIEPVTDSEPTVRSRSISELAADEAERLDTRINTLRAKLKKIRTELADPLAVDLLHSSDTERTIMRATIGSVTESIAAATRARKAALRRSGQRIGLAALSE